MLPVLYPVLDTALLESHGLSPVAAAEAMLDAGVQILQWRCKDPVTRARFDEADAISKLCKRYGARFIVNDRADLALMLDGGLHIGQDDMPAALAREVAGAHTVIGLSTHNPAQFAHAMTQPVDYIAVGPVFSTATKANPDPVVGLDLVREVASRTDRPLVAIGGITRENANAVLAAGADSVAVISDLIPGVCTKDNIRRRVREWFDALE